MHAQVGLSLGMLTRDVHDPLPTSLAQERGARRSVRAPTTVVTSQPSRGRQPAFKWLPASLQGTVASKGQPLATVWLDSSG